MELLVAFLGFVIVATITPGPNNLLLAASGMRFGPRATVPHLIGIHCGVYAMAFLTALGLDRLLLAEPRALLLLKIFGSGYLLYLAWKIFGMRLAADDPQVARPMTVWQASLFQFSNPKAWLITTAGFNAALPLGGTTFEAVLILCLGFATLGLACNCLWVALGAALRGWMHDPVRRRWINGSLAAITVGTVVMFWVD